MYWQIKDYRGHRSLTNPLTNINYEEMDLFSLEKRMFFTFSMSGKSGYKGNNDRLFSMSLAARRKWELAVSAAKIYPRY